MKTETIATLEFSTLDTSCLIVLRPKAASGRLIDDRFTIEKVNSASFDIVGSGGEPGNLTSIADRSKFHKLIRPAS